MATPIGGNSKGMDYEKVRVLEWIKGKIIEFDVRAKDKEFFNAKTKEKTVRLVDQIRFKFELEGYEYPHFTNWLTQSTSEKANLFKFLRGIMPTLEGNATVDIDKVVNVPLLIMYDEIPRKDGLPGMYQFVDKIKIDGEPIDLTLKKEESPAMVAPIKKEEEDVPF
jgi:hypothetical protein